MRDAKIDIYTTFAGSVLSAGRKYIALGARVGRTDTHPLHPPLSLVFFPSFSLLSFPTRRRRERRNTRARRPMVLLPLVQRRRLSCACLSSSLSQCVCVCVCVSGTEGAAGVVAGTGHGDVQSIGTDTYVHLRALCLRPFRFRKSAALHTYIRRHGTYVLVSGLRTNLSDLHLQPTYLHRADHQLGALGHREISHTDDGYS
jgi:hypothetical protein